MSVKLLLNNVAREPKKKMWIGYIPMDSGFIVGEEPAGDGIVDSTQLGYTTNEIDYTTEPIPDFKFDYEVIEYGLNKTLTEMDPQILHPYEIFVPEGGFTCIILPQGWKATWDNGTGSEEFTFTEGYGVNGDFSHDGTPIKELIDGVQYYVYGIMFNVEGTFKLHIDVI